MKLNKTKKLLTILVCGCLMFGLSTTAFAYTDENTSETETSSEPVIDRSDTVSSGETETNPFTADGNGTLQDEANSSQNKLFYTVTTKNNNTFFLIIDKDRTSDNVYMLSMIDESDLQDFIEEEETETADISQSQNLPTTSSGADTPESTEESENTEETEDAKESLTEKSNSNSPLGYILLILLAIGAVSAYYVLKIRPKKDMEDEEDETAYGGEEQPDDTSNSIEEETEMTEAEEDEDPEFSEENTNSDKNIPFQDYPDLEDDPDENQ